MIINYSYPGIYRNKTTDDKLMYIPNDKTQNYPFCRLQLVLDAPTNQNSIKVPKVVNPTNKKTLLIKTLGNSPMSPPSPIPTS